MKKKVNKEFWIMTIISILIIVGFFTVNPTGSAVDRYAAQKYSQGKEITTWHCGFYATPPYQTKGRWIWVSWPDTEVRLSKTIRAKDVDCVTGEWVCPYETCGDGKDVEDCYCRK